MPVELVLAPEAAWDVAEAYLWYERRRAGLGEDFLSSVDACLQGIRRLPEMYPVVHEAYRPLPDTPLSIRRVLRIVGGNGHSLRRISHLSRPRQMAPAPSLISCMELQTSERPAAHTGIGKQRALYGQVG